MIVNGGLDAFNALRGGFPTQSSVNQIQQMYQSSMGYLNEAQRTIMENARVAYRMLTQNESANLLRNLGTKIVNVWSSGIQRLESLEEVQTANNLMQRWVMAHPTTRNLYLQNRCDGYGESYENVQGDHVGAAQFDYRRVMTGVMITPEQDNAYFNLYHDHMSVNDANLSVSEQLDILSTWNLLDRLFEDQDEDPTSPFGADLG